MGIEVVCSGCSRSLVVSDEFAGKKGRCPFCKTALDIPEAVDVDSLLEDMAPPPTAEKPAQAPPPQPPRDVSPEESLAAELALPSEPLPEPKPGGRWRIIAGVSAAVFVVAILLAWLVPHWMEGGGEPPQRRKPTETAQQPAEEPGELPAVEPAAEPDVGPDAEPAVEPSPPPAAEPEPPAADIPITDEVTSLVPPNSVAYAEMSRPGAFIKAVAGQRLWNNPTHAEWVLEAGVERLGRQIEEEFKIPYDVLAAAAARASSVHLCVVDWEPRPRWAVWLRHEEPPTPTDLFGDAADKFRSPEPYRGVELYSIFLPGPKERITMACVGRYAIFASRRTVLLQMIQSFQVPPGEGPYARQPLAQRPAFRKALAARKEAGDDAWLFVDVPRLLEQSATVGFEARKWLKLDDAVNLGKLAAVTATLNLSDAPALSIEGLLKSEHPLLAALDGPEARPDPTGFVPPNATFLAWINLNQPAAAWDAWRTPLPKIFTIYRAPRKA